MKNKTTARGEGKRLTDEQLKYVVGGVSTDGLDQNADEAKMIEDAIAELDALVGDPEAVTKKMKELMELGLLEEVNEALEARAETLGAQNGTPSEEPGNAEVQPTETGGQSADTQTNFSARTENHNMAAINTLNSLNKHQSTLSKSLEKLSSGMKINSAAEDSSGYQISERMRVQIRSLDQANYNVQNGQSMLKVAGGAVSSTVEILRTLKEKVINATTDTNTEVDREAIQNEIDASIQQIDDNALLTFNGKFLNNGARTCAGVALANIMYTQQFIDTKGKLADLTDKDGNDLGLDSTDLVTFSVVKDGRTYSVTTPIGDMSFADLLTLKGTSGDDSVVFGDMMQLFEKEDKEIDQSDPANIGIFTADGKPSVRIISNEAGLEGQISGITIRFTDRNGEMRTEANSALDSFSELRAARNASMDNSVALQIGANANNVTKLSLDDMRASALGLSGTGGTVSVGDRTSATAALEVIDNALQRALNQEAKIGATMNRLEFTSNNLTTSSENLQSAESTYRDADMAKEMTEFTKNNILMQAATAMLSQANQLPQSILSILH